MACIRVVFSSKEQEEKIYGNGTDHRNDIVKDVLGVICLTLFFLYCSAALHFGAHTSHGQHTPGTSYADRDERRR